MANKTKKEIIEDLNARKIPFKEDTKYNDLVILSKMSDVKLRARKAGLNIAQIMKFENDDKLKDYLDILSPATNPDSFPKKGEIKPPPPKKEVKIENPVIFKMKREDIFIEREAMRSKLRSANRRYGGVNAKKAVKLVIYDVKTREVIEAFYKIELED